jgi:hypothetical protein
MLGKCRAQVQLLEKLGRDIQLVGDSEQISSGWESAANLGLPLARSGHIEVLGKRGSYIKLLGSNGQISSRWESAAKF